MEHLKNGTCKNQTPSTSAKRLVDKVIHSNNDGSPFRFLPNFSTPPSRFFKIKNPFDSPLIEKIHLPICSPSLFAKSTPKKNDKFQWSICEISTLRPAEIEPSKFELDQYAWSLDPNTESRIQEKIATYFNENSIVPSPAAQDVERHVDVNSTPNSLAEASSQTNLTLGPTLPKHIEEMLKSYEHPEEKEKEYLPEDVYYKKLFEVESPVSSPPMSTGGSPLQFSPIKGICDDMRDQSNCLDENKFGDCGLSPITPKTETPYKDRSSYTSIRESKSACRLIFSENMSVDTDNPDNYVPDVLDPVPLHGNSFEEIMKTSLEKTLDVSRENWEMEFKQFTQDYEASQMEISFPATPNTGSFTSQRKRLSDSFKQLQNLDELIPSENVITSRSSSDVGYCSGVASTDFSNFQENYNMCNNIGFTSSTPTKRKNFSGK